MHVVLSGYYGFDNVGDEAILFSIIKALQKMEPNIKITVLSNNPASTQKTYGVDAVNRWKLSDVSKAIKKSDGLISGGGSLLQDETGWKSIPYYTTIMRIAKWHKKPVFVYAQGMGPFNRSFSKWLVKRTLNKVDQVTVRDEDSKDLLKSIGVKKDIQIVPDPVLGLDGGQFTNDWITDENIEKPIVTVSVRNWPSEYSFMQQIASSLDVLASKGNTIVFVPMHDEHDDVASRETAGYMKEKSYIAPYNISIEEKISIIGESNILIGMRLHSLIFAAITHTPFVAISYDPKIDSFAKICEQPIAGNVNNENLNTEEIVKKAEYLLSHEHAISELLQRKVNTLHQEALKTPENALTIFKRGRD